MWHCHAEQCFIVGHQFITSLSMRQIVIAMIINYCLIDRMPRAFQSSIFRESSCCASSLKAVCQCASICDIAALPFCFQCSYDISLSRRYTFTSFLINLSTTILICSVQRLMCLPWQRSFKRAPKADDPFPLSEGQCWTSTSLLIDSTEYCN